MLITVIKTLKLPLDVPEHYIKAFLETMEVGSTLYNIQANYAFERGRLSKSYLHKQLYSTLRNEHPDFPSALIQTARDNAVESLKSMDSNGELEEAEKAPTKKKLGSLRYDRRTFSVNFKTQRAKITVMHLWQVSVPFAIPECQNDLLTWVIAGACLVYKKRLKRFYLHVTMETEVEKVTQGPMVGLDKGIKYLLATSEGNFVDSEALVSIRAYYGARRKDLQKLGTRSAKRVLRRLSGREKRCIQNLVHVVSE